MIEFGVVITRNIGCNTLILFCHFYLNVVNNPLCSGCFKTEKRERGANSYNIFGILTQIKCN